MRRRRSSRTVAGEPRTGSNEGGWGGRTRTCIWRLQRPLPYQFGDAPRRRDVAAGGMLPAALRGARPRARQAAAGLSATSRSPRPRRRRAEPRDRPRRARAARPRRRRTPPRRCPTSPTARAPRRRAARAARAIGGQSRAAAASRSLWRRAASARSSASRRGARGAGAPRPASTRPRGVEGAEHLRGGERDARMRERSASAGTPAAGSRRSPIPVTQAGRGSRKNGTSAPSPSAISRAPPAGDAPGKRARGRAAPRPRRSSRRRARRRRACAWSRPDRRRARRSRRARGTPRAARTARLLAPAGTPAAAARDGERDRRASRSASSTASASGPAEIERQEQALELVVAVGAPPDDAQPEVDLGGRGEAQRAAMSLSAVARRRGGA